jgi:hypothetical protein
MGKPAARSKRAGAQSAPPPSRRSLPKAKAPSQRSEDAFVRATVKAFLSKVSRAVENASECSDAALGAWVDAVDRDLARKHYLKLFPGEQLDEAKVELVCAGVDELYREAFESASRWIAYVGKETCNAVRFRRTLMEIMNGSGDSDSRSFALARSAGVPEIYVRVASSTIGVEAGSSTRSWSASARRRPPGQPRSTWASWTRRRRARTPTLPVPRCIDRPGGVVTPAHGEPAMSLYL